MGNMNVLLFTPTQLRYRKSKYEKRTKYSTRNIYSKGRQYVRKLLFGSKGAARVAASPLRKYKQCTIKMNDRTDSARDAHVEDNT